MKLSNYSLNYSAELAKGEMTIFDFLGICREVGLEGASLHMRDILSGKNPAAEGAAIPMIRRALLDNGLSLSMVTVSTNFSHPVDEAKHQQDVQNAIRIAELLGAPLIRIFSGSVMSAADRPQAWAKAVA